jgi:hypothetical protein
VGKAVLIVALFALLVYGALVLLERLRSRRNNSRRPGRTPPSAPPRRMVAPDDDPDFLRDIDRRLRDDNKED